jgi:hypothetical protein
MKVFIRHWLPIITRCPISIFPDLIYVTIEFENNFQELYEVRRKIRKCISGQKAFMEDLAEYIFMQFPTCKSVTLRLLFNRHVVSITRGNNDQQST